MRQQAWLSLLAAAFGGAIIDTAAAQTPIASRISVNAAVSAKVPPAVIEAAKEEASRIYAEVGIGLTWWDRSSSAVPHLTVRIVGEPFEAVSREALGIAPRDRRGPSSLLFAFYSRIERFADLHGKDVSHILGHVIAHELGHVLLPHGSHSSHGIVVAAWSRAQIEQIGRGWLSFSAVRLNLALARAAAPRMTHFSLRLRVLSVPPFAAARVEGDAHMDQSVRDLLVLPAFGEAQDVPAVFSRVRSPEPAIVSLIANAMSRSPTFRAIVEAIEASNAIVYIEHGRCGHGVRACVIAVSSHLEQRVLRIRIRQGGSNDRLASTIGHELRHAVEILENPEITTTTAMQQFYLRNGSRSLAGAIETEAALQAGRAVAVELATETAKRRRRR